MANKPFLAVHTNITDETNTTTTPAVIGKNSVVVTQAQQRRIFDTLTTSIQGNPMAAFGANFQQPQPICYCPYTQGNGFLQAQAQFIPGGVVFRFNTQNSWPPLCHPWNYNPFLSGMDQELALKEFERNGLDALLLQEKLKNNPFVLQFHQNKNTSTGDLMNGSSMGQPDFNSAAAFSANNLVRDYPMYSSEAYSKARQLNLPKKHKDKQNPFSCMEICEDKSTMTNGECNQTSQVTFFVDENTEKKDENNKETSDSKEPEAAKPNDNKNGVPCYNDANDLTTTTDSETYDEETDNDRNKNKNQDRKTRYN